MTLRFERFLAFLAFALVTLAGSSWLSGQDPELLTVAEKSDYQATCSFQDVADFVDACAARASHVTRLDFGQSVEGRPMISAVVARPPFEMGNANDTRLRLLLMGNIHSGECAGKEGLMMILRELTLDAAHPWLEDSVVVIIPNYNVDANERVGKNHRPGQLGPAKGMGQRANPQQLDLNRDFVKLESPEARSLVSLMNQFDPHMFIDCHTTNGSRHRYVLTYDIPHNPSAPQPVREFLRNRMMPAVTDALEARGVPTFYYGNFSRDYSTWVTYGNEPRYSTEYFGLRGGLGILSEAYSYAPYRERIEASKAFVEQCVNFVRENAADVKQLIAGARAQIVQLAESKPENVLVHIDSQMAPFDEKVVVRGYDGEQPKDYEVTFLGDYQPTKTVSLPFAYVIPARCSWQAERLVLHGIQVEQLEQNLSGRLATYRVLNMRKSPREFQNHRMLTLECEARSEPAVIEKGSLIVRTSQPLARLAAYLLEPESNDGLATWNFFDSEIKTGADFPVQRINEPMSLPTRSLTEIPPGGELRLENIYGPDKLELSSGSAASLTWLNDSAAYVVEKNRRKVLVDAATGAESRLQFPWDRNEVMAALEKIDGVQRSTAGEIIRGANLPIADRQSIFLFEHSGGTYAYHTEQKLARRLGSDNQPAELATLNATGQTVAFVQNGDLKLLSDLSGEPLMITSDGGEQILNGKLDWVYQEELYGRGNFKGFWWSPNSRYVAFLRFDESAVARYTVTDHLPVRGRYEITPYPKAGDPLPSVSLGVYQVHSRQLRWIDFPTDGLIDGMLISRVSWNPNGDHCLVQIQNRQQTWLDLYRVDPNSGDVVRLFRDETPAWIETPGDPVWLDDGTFVWLSPRNGFNHLYHYGPSGELIKQMTDGGWEVRSLLGVSPDNSQVFFTGSPTNPTQVDALVANLASGGIRTITSGKGTHSVRFNDDFSYFFDEFSQADRPAHVHLRRADGSFVRSVWPNLDDRLRHFRLTEPEFVNVPIEDGLLLNAQIIRPPDFDVNKKYPVLVHVYSGPQAPRVRDRFGGATYLWHQYLAQKGYVIWMCDNRSASYRGAKFAWPIHRDLGRHELQDIKAGVAWLKQKQWVDSERIGIWGWSYGGYMTAYAMTHCDLFKAGISGAPVTDWKNYDAIYTERYMDTPQNNPEGYKSSSVVEAAGDLHGKLLLIHGTIDDNVHLSNTLQLAHELQNAGKQFQLMVYPNNRHGIRDPEQQLHMYEMMTQFVLENL